MGLDGLLSRYRILSNFIEFQNPSLTAAHMLKSLDDAIDQIGFRTFQETVVSNWKRL
jgi:hypothetical protein